MESEQFIYEIRDNHALLTAVKAYGDSIVIPETLGGYPVEELAPYVFSLDENKNENEFLCGSRLRHVALPGTVASIGKYAFYNCDQLKSLTCTSQIRSLGTGLFTGCGQLSKLNITVTHEGKSCLKEILSELKQEVEVFYEDEQGSAHLVFPEFYEEAVENTPARILVTHTHGCGHRYRYCFLDTEFQFREYDSLFPYLKTLESWQTIWKTVFGRLRYPYGLSGEAEERYRDYVKEQIEQALEYVLDKKEMTFLIWMTETFLTGPKELEQALEIANRTGYTEGLSYLMDYRHQRAGNIRQTEIKAVLDSGKRRFEL